MSGLESLRRSRAARLSIIGLVGALPSFVWAVSGAALMHDDWWLADAFAGRSASEAWDAWVAAATEVPARPGGAVYYLVSYGLFGRNAWLHALLLAVVNATLCVLVYLVAERLWQPRLALWIAGFYAVMPNRGSTRLWFAVGNYPLALIFILLGVLLLLRQRPIWAGLLLAVGVLTYEGVVGLALLAIVAWVFVSWRERGRTGLVALAPIVLAALFLFLASPKRDTSGSSFGGFGSMLASQFGVGMFQSAFVATAVFVAVAAGIVVVAGRPGPHRETYRSPVLWGLGIMAAGWLPFAVTNWPIGTDGFFDRANGVIGLGTAVICGSLLALLVERVTVPVGLAVGLAVLAGLFALNLKDVRSYWKAVDEGRQLVAQVLVDIPPTDAPIRIVPPSEGSNGVDQFTFGSNLTDAIEVERGDTVPFWMNPGAESLPLPEDHLCYYRIDRILGPCEADEGS